MILLLLLVVAGLWFTNFAGRYSAWSVRKSGADAEADRQSQWRQQESTINALMQSGLENVRSGKSLGAAQFAGALDSLVRRHRFNFRLDAPSTERRPPVAIHTITLSLEKADIATIVAFVAELRTTMPLVNVEQLTLNADRRNPAQLDARLRLSALEILP